MSKLMRTFMSLRIASIAVYLYIITATAFSLNNVRSASGSLSVSPMPSVITTSLASVVLDHRHVVQMNQVKGASGSSDWFKAANQARSGSEVASDQDEASRADIMNYINHDDDGGDLSNILQKQTADVLFGDDVEMFINNHQSSPPSAAPVHESGHNSRHYNTYQMTSYRPTSATLVTPVFSYSSNNKFVSNAHSMGSQHGSNSYNLNYVHNLFSKPVQNSKHPPPDYHGLSLQGVGLPSPFHNSANMMHQHNKQHLQSTSLLTNSAQNQSSSINLIDPNNLSLADLPGSSVCGRQQMVGYREPRIVGGNSTFEGEFPWAVSIQRHGNHHCGGVIVGKRWILTAAHCVRSQLVVSLVVRTGGHTLSRSGNHPTSHLERDYVVDQIVMHDDFSRYDNLTASQMKSSANTNNADIALLRLKHEIHWNELAWPVCFPSKESGNFSGHDAIVIGWGKLNEKSEDFSDELQKVKLTIIDNKVCQNWFRQAGRDMPIDDRVICAGFKNGGKDACHGDSGGPLLSRINGQYVVVGVVSTGIGCARPLLPGLYSRVSSYIGWIERYVTS